MTYFINTEINFTYFHPSSLSVCPSLRPSVQSNRSSNPSIQSVPPSVHSVHQAYLPLRPSCLSVCLSSLIHPVLPVRSIHSSMLSRSVRPSSPSSPFVHLPSPSVRLVCSCVRPTVHLCLRLSSLSVCPSYESVVCLSVRLTNPSVQSFCPSV